MTRNRASTGQADLPSPHPTASFWLCEPSPALRGHRSTRELPRGADVVVVGSGITGAFAAWYLLRAGGEAATARAVVMLEAREACWGATGRNGGHCQPELYQTPPHIGRFELANWEHIRSFVTENDIPCEWQEAGNCHSFSDRSVWNTTVAAVESLRALDPELGSMVRIVTPVSDDPSLRLNDQKIVGAVTGTKAASLWPYKLVAWVLEKLIATHGDGAFNLQTNSPVTRLQQLDGGAWVVHTPRGMIEAKQVLLATNAYTSYLLPPFSDLIVPVRGEMSALMPPPSVTVGSGTPLAGNHSYGFRGSVKRNFGATDYLIQRPFSTNDAGEKIGGELMFGGGRERMPNLGVGISDDGEIDQPVADYLRRELNEVLLLENHGAELKASHEWSGIMGYSKDGKPWVGQVPEGVGGGEGLWVCAGFTGHGMPNASLSTKAVAYMMLGKDISDINLPTEFHISQQRVDAARAVPEVYTADIRI